MRPATRERARRLRKALTTTGFAVIVVRDAWREFLAKEAGAWRQRS